MLPRRALFSLGEREVYLRCMEEALALAERLGDEEQLARVWRSGRMRSGSPATTTRALESGHRAVTLAEAVGRPSHQIPASLTSPCVLPQHGRLSPRPRHCSRRPWNCSEVASRERLGRNLYPAVSRNPWLAAGARPSWESSRRLRDRTRRPASGRGEALDHPPDGAPGSCETLVGLARSDASETRSRHPGLRDAGLLVWAVIRVVLAAATRSRMPDALLRRIAAIPLHRGGRPGPSRPE